MIEQITTEAVFAYFVIFCRLGAAILLLPSLGEGYISPRARLIVAAGLTVIFTPIASTMLPPLPGNILDLFFIMAKEILIGVFIGTIAKIILSVMHIAGMIISYQSGLAAGAMFDPTQGQQGAIIGTFLTFMATLLIFVMNLHHIFLRGILESYTLFDPSQYLPLSGFAQAVLKIVSDAFLMGLKIATPHIVIGLVLFLGAGVMGRLMPQMQVFFVIIPLQIVVSFFILMVTISGILLWFMSYYQEAFGSIFFF